MAICGRLAKSELAEKQGLPPRAGTLSRRDRSLRGNQWSMAMAVIINKDGGGSGGSALMGFILGAVLLVVGVVGFFMWDNYKSGGAPKAVVITTPK